MRYTKSPLRPGATAIAAVLALSSTPLFAQATETAPLVTPPPVAAPAPEPAAAVAPAPVAAAPAPVAAPTAASSPSLSAVADSIRADTAAETPTNAAPVRSAPARTAQAAPVTRRVQAAAPVVVIPAAVPAAAIPAPPAPAPVVQSAPVEFDPQPAPPPAPAADASNDLLPIAGGLGAAILLLGGGAFALTRRRRRENDYAYNADEVTTVEAMPAPATATPAHAAPLAAEPAAPFVQPGVTQPVRSPESVALSGGPVTALPAGFDLSRYGRHVQAAYQGPTENNRSLSLRRRLARARFHDQRERMVAEGKLPPQSAHPAATQPTTAPRQTEYVTARVKHPPRPGFRPAYSS